MKGTKLFILATAALGLAVGGCGTTSTAVRISATPGAHFTTQYRAGEHSGTVTTVAPTGGSATVLEMPGRDLTCEVSKQEQSDQLIVEIRQAGQTVFRAEAPPGTAGVRISHTATGWRQQTY